MNWKAYPATWALYAATRAAAARWQRQGLLTAEQHAAIEAASPLDFYRPSVWLRITLFLFTGLAVAMGGGTVSLFFLGILDGNGSSGSQDFAHTLAVIYAGGGFLLLELIIRNSRHYQSGVDNALLYTALGAGLTLLGLFYNDLTPSALFFSTPRILFLFVLPALLLLLAAVVRYADALVAALAYLTYLGFVAGLLLLVPGGILLLPFGLMGASAGAYGALQRWVAPRPDLLYYHTAYQVARVLALVTFYLGGNYLVVREGYGALTHSAAGEIAFYGLFYVFTAVIPLLYVVAGLRRHDRPLLLTGVGVLSFSLYTYRYYHAMLPPALAATLGGALLIGAAIAAMRYLRTERHGLTAAADDEPRHFDLEALVVAQQAPDLPTGPPPTDGFGGFGGGQLGGGGASSTY